jgi:hypothetical protein
MKEARARFELSFWSVTAERWVVVSLNESEIPEPPRDGGDKQWWNKITASLREKLDIPRDVPTIIREVDWRTSSRTCCHQGCPRQCRRS